MKVWKNGGEGLVLTGRRERKAMMSKRWKRNTRERREGVKNIKETSEWKTNDYLLSNLMGSISNGHELQLQCRIFCTGAVLVCCWWWWSCTFKFL
jgi:hypothetical protein